MWLVLVSCILASSSFANFKRDFAALTNGRGVDKVQVPGSTIALSEIPTGRENPAIIKPSPKYGAILEYVNIGLVYSTFYAPIPGNWYIKAALVHILLRLDLVFHLAKLVPKLGVYWHLCSLQFPIFRYIYQEKCGVCSFIGESVLHLIFSTTPVLKLSIAALVVTLAVMLPLPDVLSHLSGYHSAAMHFSKLELERVLAECESPEKQPKWKAKYLDEFKRQYTGLVRLNEESRRQPLNRFLSPTAKVLRLTNVDDCCELNCFPILLCNTRRFEEYVHDDSPICASLHALRAARGSLRSLNDLRITMGAAFEPRPAFSACNFPGRGLRELLRVIPSLRCAAALHSFLVFQKSTLDDLIGTGKFPSLSKLMLLELWHLPFAAVTCEETTTLRSKDETGSYEIVGTYEQVTGHAYVHVYHGKTWYSVDNGIVKIVDKGCTPNTRLVVYERL